jgi:hypothetical protein
MVLSPDKIKVNQKLTRHFIRLCRPCRCKP